MSNYVESKYFADPDFLVTVDTANAEKGEHIPVEVGYGYRFGKGKNQTIRLVLATGIHEKQLIFEATAIELSPFARTVPAGVGTPKAQPRQAYRPANALTR